ncbi:hypothetical protein I7I50_02001 [Histoplasma capsulatum G186AR]|uniref:Uncharacterized protein n=1 Tax=Ajellomyces capsulatus TaxID=5037 RepID=A0A8H8CS56_AJECA|nr:hypothetical protein I7I52_12215 [Histoplasma capsulatum]QSS71236.1 hypothetical protein I7I50_02001 [Histoplasma capsulatum G186AR]
MHYCRTYEYPLGRALAGMKNIDAHIRYFSKTIEQDLQKKVEITRGVEHCEMSRKCVFHIAYQEMKPYC